MNPSSLLIKEMLDRVGVLPPNMPFDGMPGCFSKAKYMQAKKRSNKLVPGPYGRLPLAFGQGPARRPFPPMDNSHFPNYLFNMFGGDESHAPIPGNYDSP